MKKITKKVALEVALSAVKNWEIQEYHVAGDDSVSFSAEEIISKLNEMIVALDKKSDGEKKPTEQQIANTGFKGDIVNLLSDGKPRTATEILNEVPTFTDAMTNQRVSQLLRQLVLGNVVKREVVKGKAVFSLVEGE